MLSFYLLFCIFFFLVFESLLAISVTPSGNLIDCRLAHASSEEDKPQTAGLGHSWHQQDSILDLILWFNTRIRWSDSILDYGVHHWGPSDPKTFSSKRRRIETQSSLCWKHDSYLFNLHTIHCQILQGRSGKLPKELAWWFYKYFLTVDLDIDLIYLYLLS